MQLCNSVLLLMDALAWAFRGEAGNLGYYMVRISNFSVFMLELVIVILFHTYVCRLTYNKEKNSLQKCAFYSVYIIEGIGMILTIVSQFINLYYYFDEANTYHRTVFHPISVIIGLIGGIIDLLIIIINRKKYSRMILVSTISYIVLPILSCVVMIFYYGVSLINIATTISMVFMFIVEIQEQSRMLAQKEKEAFDLKVSIMLSQIGPHFIYNTLSTIRYLCKNNPEEAVETIDEFASYLRGNIDYLGEKKNIAFSQELNHVKNYLAIEKKRFGDKIEVVYNIKKENFLIPALTVQPLVENAVKHGIRKKREGGLITISSYEQNNSYKVVVNDNGVGFDINNLDTDDKVHIGLKNIKNRIEECVNGTVSIESQVGKGTCITITIPQTNNKETKGKI